MALQSLVQASNKENPMRQIFNALKVIKDPLFKVEDMTCSIKTPQTVSTSIGFISEAVGDQIETSAMKEEISNKAV